MGAFTPFPGNGGTTVAAYSSFSPMLRDDFSGRFTGALTIRSLSWHPPAGYCFPSSQFPIYFVSIVYPFGIVKSQDSRKISFFSREIMRFSNREM